MKKLIYTIAAFVALSLGFASCNKDVTATATMNYFATTETIAFSTPDDTIFRPYIYRSLVNMHLTSNTSYDSTKTTYNVITENGTSSTGIALYAIAECDEQARKTFETKMKTITLDSVKYSIYAHNLKDTLINHYPTYADLPLHPFSFTYNITRIGGVKYGNESIVDPKSLPRVDVK